MKWRRDLSQPGEIVVTPDELARMYVPALLRSYTREELLIIAGADKSDEEIALEAAEALVDDMMPEAEREQERREEEFERRRAYLPLDHPTAPPEDNPSLAVWRADNAHLLRDPCSYCGAPSVSLDHITPQWRGGANTDDNVTPACARCNSSKGKKPLLLWMAGRP